MKIVIISDVHGNFDALSALQEDYDQLWVLGDLVNYGPQPAEVIRFIRSRATHVAITIIALDSAKILAARRAFARWRKRRGSTPIRS